MNIINTGIVNAEIPNNLPDKILVIYMINDEDDDKYFTLKRSTKNILDSSDSYESDIIIRVTKYIDCYHILFYWRENDITDYEINDFNKWINDICINLKKLKYVVLKKKKENCELWKELYLRKFEN